MTQNIYNVCAKDFYGMLLITARKAIEVMSCCFFKKTVVLFLNLLETNAFLKIILDIEDHFYTVL